MDAQELLCRYAAGERNFTGVNLRGISLRQKCLVDINLSNANPSSLSSSILINANLSGANLSGIELVGTNFINANLRGANLRNAVLAGADLTGADLTGADLTGAKLSYYDRWSNARLIGTNLTDADLTSIQGLEYAIFAHTTMPDGSIVSAPDRVIDAQELLRRYEAGDRDFSTMILHRADLSGVNLQSVDLCGVYFSYVNLRNATLHGALTAKFIYCDMRDIELISSCPDYRDQPSFTYCDLRRARMGGGIDFSGARFIGDNFQEARGVSNGGGEGGAFFCNTTWVNGEFIAGPFWAEERWKKTRRYFNSNDF